jgi:hypothetical protein
LDVVFGRQPIDESLDHDASKASAAETRGPRADYRRRGPGEQRCPPLPRGCKFVRGFAGGRTLGEFGFERRRRSRNRCGESK